MVPLQFVDADGLQILNKELWAANKQWFSSLAVKRAANTPYHKKNKML
jgi:hypothetical protein